MTTTQSPKPRGFAAMPFEERSRISRMGGLKSQELGVAYRWNSETAAKAGQKGGRISRRGKNKPKLQNV